MSKSIRRRHPNPVDFVKHRALWLGGLAAIATVAVGGIAYAAGKSAGSTQTQANSQSLTLSGSGKFANTYPAGSIVTIGLPAGATWGATGAVPSSNSGQFTVLSAPTSGNAPAQIVYKGGSGIVTVAWVDAKGNQMSTELDFNG